MTPLLLVCVLLAAEVSPLQTLRDEFDEPVRRLAPAQERDEAAQAKVTAEALYAHGRFLLQRGESPAALRRFQRAWRYHPHADAMLPQIVLLAHQLRRSDEAARYALLIARPADISSALLRQLAVQLSARQQWPQALALFEASLPAGAQLASHRTKADEDIAALLVYLEIGRLALLTRDFPKSADFFARVNDALENPERLVPNDEVKQALLGQADRTYRLMAETFFLAERYEHAEASVRRAFSQPDDRRATPQLDFHLARIAAKRGQRDEALRYLESYFDAQSSAAGSDPYALLAEVLSRAEPDTAAAEQQLRSRLEELLATDSRNVALIAYLAEFNLRTARLEAAEQQYDQLLVLRPSEDVYRGLADIYGRQNRPEKLAELCGTVVAKGGNLSDLRSLLESVEKYPELRAALIVLMQQQRRDDLQQVPAGALLAAAVLAEADSQPPSADFPAADALFADGASRLEPPARAETLLAWGLKLLLAGQRERAVPIFRQALAANLPEERKLACYFYLTRALALAAKPGEALQVAEEAAQAFPEAVRLQAQPGWVLYYTKRYDEAERSYQALLERFDSRPAGDVRDAMRDARLILSNIGVQKNRMAEAEEWLEQVLDEFPEDLGALNDLGYLWADQGKNLNRALDMTRRAVAGRPDNAAYRDSLGWTLYRLDRIPEAIQELEQAAAGGSPDGVILDHLGDAYLRANRAVEALAIWRRAASAFATEQDQEKRQTTEEKIKRYEK